MVGKDLGDAPDQHQPHHECPHPLLAACCIPSRLIFDAKKLHAFVDDGITNIHSAVCTTHAFLW